MAKSIRMNAILRMALNVLNVAIPLLAGPYLARILAVDLYGEYNRATSIVSWFVPFASFGIYNYGIRSISEIKHNPKEVERLFSNLFIMGAISSTIVFGIYMAYVVFLPAESYPLVYAILSIQIVSQMFYVEWMNEAFENYGFILLKTMVVKLIHLVSIFVFVRKASDIAIYALIVSITMFFNYFISFLFVKKNIRFCNISFQSLKKLIGPLCIMLLLANANMLFTYLDRLFLSLFSVEGKFISYYQFSLSIVMVITQVINSIVIVTIPRLSNYLAVGRRKQYLDLLNTSSRTFYLIGIPMCIGLSCFSKPIMFAYGGINYLSASTCLSLLSVRTLLWLWDRILANQILFVHGKEIILTKIYLLSGIVNLLLNTLLVVFNYLTPELLIVTTIISEVIMVLLQIITIKKNIDINIKIINGYAFRYFIISLVFYPIAYYGIKILNIQYVLNSIFLPKIGFLICLCILYYFILLGLIKDEVLLNNMNFLIRKIKRGK